MSRKPAKVPPEEQAAAPADAGAAPATVVLRFVGDGSIFQSGIPNRDVTEADNLPDELLGLAVDTGTHERV